MTVLARIWRLVRSRHLAVWAIAAFAVYSAAATLTSRGGWSTPFGNPIFAAIVAVLAVSTAACAWERTAAAMRNAPLKLAAQSTLGRLKERAPIVVPVAEGTDAILVASDALRGLRMRVLHADDALEARAGTMGAFGSPIFHWSLALLIVVVALGQLTRAEGLMGVIAGSAKHDSPASYGTLHTGPLVGDLTDRVVAVPRISSEYRANGVGQGITPYVELRSPDGAQVLTSGWVYPNHPLRYRSMFVHSNAIGLGAVIRVSGAGEDVTSEVLLDYTEDRSAIVPAVAAITGTDGRVLSTIVLEPTRGSTPEAPVVHVRATQGDAPLDSSATAQADLPLGGQLQLSPGLVLTVERLTKYVRLSVVDDWSVPFIYALFALAAVGLVLAVFSPLRGVRAVLVDDADGLRLHVAVRHGRGDPNFPTSVTAALAAAMEHKESA